MVGRLALVTAAILLASCGATPTVSPGPSTETAGPSASSSRPNATLDPILAVATGPWRRQPVRPSPGMTEPVEAACRAAEPGIGELPVALADLRGQSQVTLVFADGPSGYACWSVLDQSAEATVVVLKAPAKPVDAIDVAHYALVPGPDGGRSLIIGRIGPISHPRQTLGGPTPARIIAGFTNETFVWATYADPWYAMWWPGAEQSDGIAVTNTRNEVIASVQADLPALNDPQVVVIDDRLVDGPSVERPMRDPSAALVHCRHEARGIPPLSRHRRP